MRLASDFGCSTTPPKSAYFFGSNHGTQVIRKNCHHEGHPPSWLQAQRSRLGFMREISGASRGGAMLVEYSYPPPPCKKEGFFTCGNLTLPSDRLAHQVLVSKISPKPSTIGARCNTGLSYLVFLPWDAPPFLKTKGSCRKEGDACLKSMTRVPCTTADIAWLQPFRDGDHWKTAVEAHLEPFFYNDHRLGACECYLSLLVLVHTHAHAQTSVWAHAAWGAPCLSCVAS